MFRIKRTKKAPGLDLLPPAVHYITAVAPDGSLEGFTEDAGRAVLVDAAMVAKVQAYYRRRENVGQLTFEPVEEPPKAEPVAPEPMPAQAPVKAVTEVPVAPAPVQGPATEKAARKGR